jgi:hypothetical protein
MKAVKRAVGHQRECYNSKRVGVPSGMLTAGSSRRDRVLGCCIRASLHGGRNSAGQENSRFNQLRNDKDEQNGGLRSDSPQQA